MGSTKTSVNPRKVKATTTLGLAVLGSLSLSSCAGLMAGAAATGATSAAVSFGPTLYNVFTTGQAILSDTAKLACATQAFANEANNPRLSYYAGLLCKW